MYLHYGQTLISLIGEVRVHTPRFFIYDVRKISLIFQYAGTPPVGGPGFRSPGPFRCAQTFGLNIPALILPRKRLLCSAIFCRP
jgi:hypothetical protein